MTPLNPRRILPLKIRRKLRETGVNIKQAAAEAFQKINPEGRGHHPTASREILRKHGGIFLATFPKKGPVGRNRELSLELTPSEGESPLALAITDPAWPGKKAQAKLGFESGTVIVERFSGPEKMHKDPPAYSTIKEAEKIRNELGEPWQKFLLDELEHHARETGMNAVKIRDPATSPFFWNKPVYPPLPAPEEIKILARMRFLRKQLELGRTAQARTEEIKLLNEMKNNPHEPEEVKETLQTLLIDRKKNRVTFQGIVDRKTPSKEWTAFWNRINSGIRARREMEVFRRRDRSNHALIAKANGYRKEGDFWVKRLSGA
ncbi:MAG: hypothetical protein HY917_00110 [Candidatus Diapherotrites archaeon]|nr:hypothetical protein [Candidatus Diapherotrites archaeon]